MLIQKQSCSSCAIFVGSIFSSRFISDLGYKIPPINHAFPPSYVLIFFCMVAYLIVSSILEA